MPDKLQNTMQTFIVREQF